MWHDCLGMPIFGDETHDVQAVQSTIWRRIIHFLVWKWKE